MAEAKEASLRKNRSSGNGAVFWFTFVSLSYVMPFIRNHDYTFFKAWDTYVLVGLDLIILCLLLSRNLKRVLGNPYFIVGTIFIGVVFGLRATYLTSGWNRFFISFLGLALAGSIFTLAYWVIMLRDKMRKKRRKVAP